MVKRNISKRNLVMAIILTIILFSMGIMLGLLVSEKRIQNFEKVFDEGRLDYESLQLQFRMIDNVNKEKSCPIVLESLKTNVNRLITSGKQIEKYSKDINNNPFGFDLLKREHILAQLNYWFLIEESKKICNKDVVTIIYFYSDTDDCLYCSTQSTILSYLKGKFKEKVMVFSFDASFDKEALIPILTKVYNVKEYPSLIIEGQTHQGLIEIEELEQIVCTSLKSPNENCP